jgi:hypothetical protein
MIIEEEEVMEEEKEEKEEIKETEETEEKDREEVRHWKDLLAEHPEQVKIEEIPKQVAELLAMDPDAASGIAEAIARSLPLEEGQGGALDGEPPVAGEETKESAYTAAMRARKEREDREQKDEQLKKLSLLARIAKLDVGEKSKLARTGDKDTRSILIRDSNKQVSMAVLANPKMTIQEIEMTAASRNVTEDILREIGNNRDWCKSYTVILALVNNPKTPIGISLTHLPKLLLRDIRFISKSKGIPDAIRMTAKRIAQKKTH